jgi:hypothetical protein
MDGEIFIPQRKPLNDKTDKNLYKILIALTLLSPSAHADFFSDAFDWVVDNPEYGIPAAIIGAPVALAAAPMIVSYALFPFILHICYPIPTGHNLGYQHSHLPITLIRSRLLIFYSFFLPLF